MKIRALIISLSASIISGCGMLVGYPTTNFYVKNSSEQEVLATITVLKYSSINGPYEMTQTFVFPPNDSILARQIGFKPDGENPQGWFTKFQIQNFDTTIHNDPYQRENWLKRMTEAGIPYYVFVVNK